jgi:hypothetical protein
LSEQLLRGREEVNSCRLRSNNKRHRALARSLALIHACVGVRTRQPQSSERVDEGKNVSQNAWALAEVQSRRIDLTVNLNGLQTKCLEDLQEAIAIARCL